MSNQLLITGGAKVRNLQGVITGTSGVLSSVPLGGANGVATLDSGGKVPVSQLPSSVVTYLGTWNAATNTPTLTNGTGDAGDMYICNVAGTVNFGAGPITFAVGDWVLYGSGTWQKSNGQNGTVTSVAVTETGDALTITGSPITTAGTINIGFAGTGSQYIKGDGTLATFPTTINEAKRLVTEVYNESGATLTKGTVVYINGGHGNLPTVTKAIATSDATSAQTYGVVQSDITNMNNGYVVVIGSLTDLDTQAYANGTQLYLSSTTAGAWTSVKQYAPAHLVYVGIVTRSHPTQGVVEIKIQNGYELDELHNVSAQTPSNNQGLFYNSSNSLWENKSIATALGYTPANDALVVHLAGSENITGQKTFTTGIIGTTATFTTALDSGYSLQLKNSALNSNGVGFGVDSTYGNVFTTLKDGVAAARNLTLQNQGGYVSIDESGNFGVNILTPKGGVDIYQSTTASLYLHNSASGVSATDGVRLSLNASNANLRNYESGTLTMTSEGNFSVITASTENFRVNALDGSIYQSYVPNAMLKSVSGVLTAAVAGTDYVAPSALSGYVPTSRTLTINGTTYDLSANRSWSVGSVTSVGLSSATTGVTIGSSPITTSGTITLSIATASSTQQGLLSAADWTTFNSKQNAITNPVTGVGSADSVAYWNSSSNITYDSTFYYSASNKRLGVNTNTPNATIGANIAIDGGYGLLVKNADNNYNGLGIGIDSTYGNLIASQKLGTASARNVTILNQSGYHSLTEAGSFGLNILTPTASPSGVGSVGIDVYGGSNAAGIGFHNVASGVGNTNGAYIYFTNALSLTLRNLEGSIVSSSLGDFSVITNSTENFRVNASTGSLWQSNITNAILKANSSNVIVAAVAGTDYQAPITLTTTGSSGAATFSSNTLNVPNYTLSGLGGVPTSRTLTINGTAYDLSADRSWSVGTLTGGGADGRVAFWNGASNVVSDSLFVWDDTNNRLGIGLVNPQRALEIYSSSPDTHLRLSGAAPSVSMGEAITGSIYQAKFGLATASNQFVTGSVAGDFVINNQTGSTIWAYNSTEKMRLDTNGNLGVGSIANSSYRLHVFGTGTMLGIETTAASNVYLRMLQAGTVVGGMYYNNSDSTLRINNNNGGLRFDTSTVNGALTIASTGAATFSSSVTATSFSNAGLYSGEVFNATKSNAGSYITYLQNTSATGYGLYIQNGNDSNDAIRISNAAGTANNIQLYGSGQAYFKGNVGIGTSSPQTKLNVNGTDLTSFTSATYGSLFLQGGAYTGSQIQAMDFGSTSYGKPLARIGAKIAGAGSYLYFGTSNDYAIGITNTALTIDYNGNVYIGEGYGQAFHRINKVTSEGNGVVCISGYSGASNDTAIFYASSGTSGNAAATSLWLSRNSSTFRSINAGGTINAAGTDYAEYMTKAIEDNISKGDIVGVDANGLLTNIFNNAKSFVVKSTDPSYVGGDLWAEVAGKRPSKTTEQTEEEFASILAEFELKLEAARQKVDRIAFSGQVPCNVYNANVGDYIIPIELEDGKISGQAVSNPTFEQYQISVGKVWKIIEDGRAWIAVKIG